MVGWGARVGPHIIPQVVIELGGESGKESFVFVLGST